jgi:signal transduction histidine kinase
MIKHFINCYSKAGNWLLLTALTIAWLTILLVLTSSQVSAILLSPPRNPEPLILTDSQGKYPLGLYLQILEDSGGKLTIKDVTSPAFAAKFTPSRAQNPVYGFTDSAYWVRLELDNETSQTTDWVMTVNFANMHYVDLYTPFSHGGGFSEKQSGTLRPVSGRDIIYPRIAFKLNVPTGTHQTYYLRFKNGASMTLGMTLFTMQEYMQQSQQVLLLYGFLFGALCALIAYHIFLLATLRELSYGYFVLLLFCLLVTLLIYDGYIPAYVFPDVNAMPLYAFPVADIGLYMSIGLFSTTFLEIKKYHSGLYWVNAIIISVGGIMMMMIFLISFGTMARLVTTWSLAILVVVLVSGFVSWRRGYHPASIFMISWLALVASLVLLEVVRKGILPSSFIAENSFQPAFIVMAVGWSLALADRINVLKDQTETANKRLRNGEHELAQILDGVPVGVAVYGSDELPKYGNKRLIEILGNPERGIRPDPKSGRTLAQAMDYFSLQIAGTTEKYPYDLLPIYRALQGVASSADDLEANLVDRVVPLEMWASPIFDDAGNVASAVIAILDISQRKQTGAELIEYRRHLESMVEKRTADLQGINNWLNAINEVQQTLHGAKDIPEVYKKLSAIIANVLNAQAVFIADWAEQLEYGGVYYESGEEPRVTKAWIGRLKASVVRDPVFYRKNLTRKPILLTADQKPNFSFVFENCLPLEEMQLFLVVPMIIRENVSGLVGIVFRDPDVEISQQQMLLMEKIAFDAANTTQQASLLDQSLELATMEERQRIARDLHDSVTQTIYTASLFSTTLPQRIRRDTESALETAEELIQLTRGALAEMRTLLLELRPAGLTKMSLNDLLIQLAQAYSGRSDFSIELDVDDVPLLPPDVQVVFYRIAQEALNNILKHANAKQVALHLKAEPSFASNALDDWHGIIQLIVEDDGIGFDPELINYEHFGLGIMEERAGSIQAQFHVKSNPGEGTEVLLTWQS